MRITRFIMRITRIMRVITRIMRFTRFTDRGLRGLCCRNPHNPQSRDVLVAILFSRRITSRIILRIIDSAAGSVMFHFIQVLREKTGKGSKKRERVRWRPNNLKMDYNLVNPDSKFFYFSFRQDYGQDYAQDYEDYEDYNPRNPCNPRRNPDCNPCNPHTEP